MRDRNRLVRLQTYIGDGLRQSARRPRANKITSWLPLSAGERERGYPALQLVHMPLGKVSYESGDVLRHVYFPTDSIVSLLYVLADGASAEISVVGNEGLIGIALFIHAWADHGAGPAQAGRDVLRVLCRGQERNRSLAAATSVDGTSSALAVSKRVRSGRSDPSTTSTTHRMQHCNDANRQL